MNDYEFKHLWFDTSEWLNRTHAILQNKKWDQIWNVCVISLQELEFKLKNLSTTEFLSTESSYYGIFFLMVVFLAMFILKIC